MFAGLTKLKNEKGVFKEERYGLIHLFPSLQVYLQNTTRFSKDVLFCTCESSHVCARFRIQRPFDFSREHLSSAARIFLRVRIPYAVD